MSRSISISSMGGVSRTNSATPTGPIQAASLLMNKRASASDSLYYICLNLIKRIELIPGMEMYLSVARANAEVAVEQQSLLLDQIDGYNKTNTSDSVRNFHWSGVSTSSSNSSSLDSDNLMTFAAGRLPTQVDCDPVTLVSKVIEQGAPLCLLYNSVNLQDKIDFIQSSEMNRCKRNVLNFIVHSKKILDIPDFTVSDVFSKNTSDLLKIINAINTVLDLDQSRFPRINGVVEPQINGLRSKVVREILETERKYVQDLEILLKYKLELEEKELISSEIIRLLFPNLNEIVDFQRKFLVGLEVNATVDEEYQRIGSVILHASSHPFKAYSPWSVGQMAAIALINKEYISLRNSSTLIDAPYELQSFLIKPIQRLCKYPLLLQELVKLSNPNFSNKRELDKALIAAKEVANSVNELQRRAENEDVKRDLIIRVKDWRGYSLDNFGDLLYHATLGVTDSGSEREFQVYLLEKIVFFFKEIVPPQKKNLLANRKKSSGSLNNSSTSLNSASNIPNEYELKGRIFINNIEEVRTSNQVNGHTGYYLTISWTGSKDSGTFLLKFKTEEIRSQWEICLNSLLLNISNNSSQSVRSSYEDLKFSPLGESQPSSARNSYHEQFVNSTKHLRSSSSHSHQFPAQQQRQNSYSSIHGTPLHQQSIMEDKKYRSVSSPMPFNGARRISDSVNSVINSMNGITLTPTSQSSSSTTLDEEIRIEILYNEEKFHLSIPRNFTFVNLKLRISRFLEKNKLLVQPSTSNIKLRYRDDDDDFVALEGTDDWNIAKDMLDELDDEEKMLRVLVSH